VDHPALLRPIAIVIIDLALGTEGEGDVGLVVVAVQQRRSARYAEYLRNIGAQ
jgi:hypothetical protein